MRFKTSLDYIDLIREIVSDEDRWTRQHFVVDNFGESCSRIGDSVTHEDDLQMISLSAAISLAERFCLFDEFTLETRDKAQAILAIACAIYERWEEEEIIPKILHDFVTEVKTCGPFYTVGKRMEKINDFSFHESTEHSDVLSVLYNARKYIQK